MKPQTPASTCSCLLGSDCASLPDHPHLRPPPTLPQPAALSTRLSSALNCAVDVLVSCSDGFWFTTCCFWGGWWIRERASVCCCAQIWWGCVRYLQWFLIHLPSGTAPSHWLYWPRTSDLPVTPYCLQATSCQLRISYPPLLPGSGMSISSTGFATAAPTSVCQACAAKGRRDCLQEGAFVAARGLVWGQLRHLQGWEINSHQCEFKMEKKAGNRNPVSFLNSSCIVVPIGESAYLGCEIMPTAKKLSAL